MEALVVKAGSAASLQGAPRWGHQHRGIGEGGAMDTWAQALANASVGNEPSATVLEFAFPAPTLRFEGPAVVAVAGGDFSPHFNGVPFERYQPLCISSGGVLEFRTWRSGRFGYLAVQGGWDAQRWLGSTSTCAAVGRGGLAGAFLKAGDRLWAPYGPAPASSGRLLWRLDASPFYPVTDRIRCVRGPELDQLQPAHATDLFTQPFRIATRCNRMAYEVHGPRIERAFDDELLSSPVATGTVQLLPDGHLLVLMADHPTTGGYPRIANLIAADRSLWVQWDTGRPFFWSPVSVEDARALYASQQATFDRLYQSAKLRWNEYLRLAR